MMETFVIVCLVMGAIVLVFVSIFHGFDLLILGRGFAAAPYLIAGFLGCTLGMTVLVQWVNNSPDPYPTSLCLAGHQQWRIVSNGKMTSRVKAWACDQREEP